jgi:homoprotocatechuate degradation regulator HpaR
MPDDHMPNRMAEDELYAIALACTRGRETIVSRFRDLLAAHALTEQQWRVMRVMHEAGSIETTDLCARCCIHKASMMRILRALVERGLVEREMHEQDKRRHIVSITGSGSALIARLLPAARMIYDSILDRFGREKARQLVRLLDELAQLHV